MSSSVSKPSIDKMNILYAAYGRAGKACLDIFLEKIDPNRTFGIFCFTYDHEENGGFLSSLKSHDVPYSTDRLTAETCSGRFEQIDLVISMHYRDLISGDVIEMSRLGGMNLHPSLLPKYRGTFSAPWVIINDEKKTGITYHYMNEKFDDGKIILQKSIPVEANDTGFSLFNKLIDLGVASFEQAFRLVVHERFEGRAQTGEPSYFPRKVPFGGRINPEWDEERIRRFIRALNFPGKPPAHIEVENKKHYFQTYEQYKTFLETGRG